MSCVEHVSSSGTFWAQSEFLASFSLWMYFWTQKVLYAASFSIMQIVQSQTIISEELYVPKTCRELPLKSLVRTLELLRRGLKNNLCSTITLLLLSWTFIWGMEIDSEEVLKQFKWKEGIDKVIVLWQRQPVEPVMDVVWWVIFNPAGAAVFECQRYYWVFLMIIIYYPQCEDRWLHVQGLLSVHL